MQSKLITALSAVVLCGVMATANSSKPAEAAIAKPWHWDTTTITYHYDNVDKTTASAINSALYNFNKQNGLQYKYDPNGVVVFKQKPLFTNRVIGESQVWTINNRTQATRSEISISNSPELYREYGNALWSRQYATAMHEIGHTSGLEHNQNSSISVMRQGRPYTVNKLSYDDKIALQNKYGAFTQPVFKKGVVTINYVPGYGVNLYQGACGQFTGRRLKTGTSWKFHDAIMLNNQLWYNLGGNQWVAGVYTTTR